MSVGSYVISDLGVVGEGVVGEGVVGDVSLCNVRVINNDVGIAVFGRVDTFFDLG